MKEKKTSLILYIHQFDIFVLFPILQVKKSDFSEFDYIFGMDDDNMHDLGSLSSGQSKAKVELLGDYDPEGERIIRDPYYVSIILFHASY